VCEHAKPFLTQNYIVTCVPLHPQKKRDRGFNQSELMAKGISKHFGFDFKHTLNRISDSSQHAGMNRQERLEDENPFELASDIGSKIKGRDILIVDDVCTTGSTLFNCAYNLQKAKPKSISSIVLFRGLK
jgi:competence protein ComFC